jgi:hypothetical protein
MSVLPETDALKTIDAIRKKYEELTDPDTLQCSNCGVKLIGEIFKSCNFCPLCRAPKYKTKEIRAIEKQLESVRRSTSPLILPGDADFNI